MRYGWSREEAATFIILNTPSGARRWLSKGQLKPNKLWRWEVIDDWREECVGLASTESPQYISYLEELFFWQENRSARPPDSPASSIEQWVRNRLDQINGLIPPLIART